MANDEFDWNGDWVPPKPVYMDDLLIVDPVLGKVPFWKSLVYNSAKLRNAIERNDSVEPTPIRDEDKPPRLGADDRPAQVSDADLKMIEQKIDALTARLDQLERRRAAEDALAALEDEVERLTPDEDKRDDDGVTLQ
jgi:hypothetical protein